MREYMNSKKRRRSTSSVRIRFRQYSTGQATGRPGTPPPHDNLSDRTCYGKRFTTTVMSLELLSIKSSHLVVLSLRPQVFSKYRHSRCVSQVPRSSIKMFTAVCVVFSMRCRSKPDISVGHASFVFKTVDIMWSSAGFLSTALFLYAKEPSFVAKSSWFRSLY